MQNQPSIFEPDISQNESFYTVPTQPSLDYQVQTLPTSDTKIDVVDFAGTTEGITHFEKQPTVPQATTQQHPHHFLLKVKSTVVGILFGPEYASGAKHLGRNFKNDIRRIIAEFFGTLLLVWFIAGIEVVSNYQLIRYTSTAKGLTGGFALVALIFWCGSISGAHLNPAITLGFTLRGVFPLLKAIMYIVTQIAGATVGAALLRVAFGNVARLGSTTPAASISIGTAVMVEIIITTFLVLIVLGSTSHAAILGATSGLAVGLALAAGLIFAWDITGASMNPARSLGPAFASGDPFALQHVWIYVVGPLVGACIAAFLEMILSSGILKNKENKMKESAMGGGHH